MRLSPRTTDPRGSGSTAARSRARSAGRRLATARLRSIGDRRSAGATPGHGQHQQEHAKSRTPDIRRICTICRGSDYDVRVMRIRRRNLRGSSLHLDQSASKRRNRPLEHPPMCRGPGKRRARFRARQSASFSVRTRACWSRSSAVSCRLAALGRSASAC